MGSSMHMIHIRLNPICYTHAEHSPTNANNIKYYLEKAMNAMKSNHLYINDFDLYTHTHTHTHTHTRNEVKPFIHK